MKASVLEKLLRKDADQVLLLSSPSNLPFSFAVHPWLIVNRRGRIERWEVLFRKKCKCQTHWGHLHRDFLPPFSGIEVIPFFRKWLWHATLLGGIEGDAAEACAEFIQKSPETYPYCHHYSIFGPNSNTYVQWVLNKFPQLGSLPSNAFGKRHT